MARSLTAKLKEAQDKIKKQQEEIDSLNSDLALYRGWMIEDLRENISLNGKNQYRMTEAMIKTITFRLQKAKWFWWST